MFKHCTIHSFNYFFIYSFTHFFIHLLIHFHKLTDSILLTVISFFFQILNEIGVDEAKIIQIFLRPIKKGELKDWIELYLYFILSDFMTQRGEEKRGERGEEEKGGKGDEEKKEWEEVEVRRSEENGKRRERNGEKEKEKVKMKM